MKNTILLQREVDGLDEAGIINYLETVTTWPVYPMRIETVERQKKAVDFLEKLRGPDGLAWLPPARAFLHEAVAIWSAEASGELLR